MNPIGHSYHPPTHSPIQLSSMWFVCVCVCVCVCLLTYLTIFHVLYVCVLYVCALRALCVCVLCVCALCACVVCVCVCVCVCVLCVCVCVCFVCLCCARARVCAVLFVWVSYYLCVCNQPHLPTHFVKWHHTRDKSHPTLDFPSRNYFLSRECWGEWMGE